MSVIVRCPLCQQRSRVGAEALGLLVACPRCPNHFVAEPEDAVVIVPDAPVPTVHPRQQPETPVVVPRLKTSPPPIDDFHPAPVGPNSFLVSVALLPGGIPLFWLLAQALSGQETVLSFAAPIALGLGGCGLCAGIAFTHWGTPARIRAMLAVVVLAYLAAGTMFFLKPGWIQELRKNFGGGVLVWREFTPPDKSYRVRFPGPPKEDDSSPVNGWPLKAYRFADPKRSDVFVAGSGSAPADWPKDANEDAWFEKAKASVVQTSGAALIKEQPIRSTEYQAREYELQFSDDQIKRVVRIVRTKSSVFYLSVDGPFLTGETPDVQEFMKSFQPGKPKP